MIRDRRERYENDEVKEEDEKEKRTIRNIRRLWRRVHKMCQVECLRRIRLRTNPSCFPRESAVRPRSRFVSLSGYGCFDVPNISDEMYK